MRFRNFKAEEITCRTHTAKNGLMLTLTADFTAYVRLLNEAVGDMNWETALGNGNHNCMVSIWDSDKSRMVSKESACETESNDSFIDAFKNACLLWGIGLELQTQPVIFVDSSTKFSEPYRVSEISYGEDDKSISSLTIVDADGSAVFQFESGGGESCPEPVRCTHMKKSQSEIGSFPEHENEIFNNLTGNSDGYDEMMEDFYDSLLFKDNRTDEIESELERTGVNRKSMLDFYHVKSLDDMDDAQQEDCLKRLKDRPTRKR